MALDSYIWRIYKQTNEYSNAIQEYEKRERYASFKPRCFTKRFGDIFLLITNNVDVFLINSDTKYKLDCKTNDMVNKKMFSPEDMPIMNRNIYELVVKESDGNVSQFAEKIGIRQQTLNRIFNTDKRSGKYPSVSDDIKRAIYNKYGITEIQLLSDTQHADMEEKNNGYNEYSERFLKVIDKLGVSDYSVWNGVSGISKEQMSKIRRGVGGASLNIIRDFGKHFEKANIDFILT